MPLPFTITTAAVDRIAAIPEPVLRNLQITQCYAELSVAFARRMGAMANWCTFATWASKQAGQTIRRQDLKRSLEAILEKEQEIDAAFSLVSALAKQLGVTKSLEQFRQSAIGLMLSKAAGRASDAVSRGNKKVFEEIAREFARFVDACFADAVYDPKHIETFIAALLPGPPPGGQDWLRQAFGCYYKALFEEDPQEKTELNLLANLQIGFHEQTRLQPEISEALNASLFDEQAIKTMLREQLLEGIGFRSKFMLFVKRLAGKTGLLDRAIEALVQRVQFHLRRALTLHLMILTIPPGRRLRLGRDLSLSYPEILNRLCNSELIALMHKTDPVRDSLEASGADDWSSLPERMHFIGELFRCCHLSPELLDEPFSPEQVAALRQGQIPGGDL